MIEVIEIWGYELPDAPIDPEYRKSLEPYSDEELTARLASLTKLHNHTDTETRDRLVRALEIHEYGLKHPDSHTLLPPMKHCITAVRFPREVLVERIGIRLRQRLESGMIEEVKQLLDSGVPEERLLRYGLEYRHVTLYLSHLCSYEEMYENLYTDIRRFSKRQMTWFRRMERNGVPIRWIEGERPFEEKVEQILELYHSVQNS